MQNSNVPIGFITVDEAIKLIKADELGNATVDVNWLVRMFPWIEPAHNFTIRLMKTDPATKKRVPAGVTQIQFPAANASGSNLQVETFKETVREIFRERTHRELNETPVRSITTARGGEEGTSKSGNPELSTMSKTKVGEDLPSQTVSMTLTGEGV